MMRALKRAGIQHKRPATEVPGDLPKVGLAEKTARSARRWMSAAPVPAMKHFAAFDVDAAPVSESLARSLHDGDFTGHTRDAAFVGATGSGKSHLAIAIGIEPTVSPRCAAADRVIASRMAKMSAPSLVCVNAGSGSNRRVTRPQPGPAEPAAIPSRRKSVNPAVAQHGDPPVGNGWRGADD